MKFQHLIISESLTSQLLHIWRSLAQFAELITSSKFGPKIKSPKEKIQENNISTHFIRLRRSRERMVNRARITTAVQFYVKDKKEGPVKEPPAKKMRITLSNIPQWSNKSLKQHVKKIEENLTLIQQGKDKEAEVFVGNNT